MVVKKAKIKFENFPGKYGQFDILDLESEKKQSPADVAPQKARLLFLVTNVLRAEIISIRVLGL